jgi:hypothetical protein
LDSFLAELDAGQDVPGLVVAAGGPKVIELLRRHERTACLPIFFWGSSVRVGPGWDGNMVRWEHAQLAQANAWHEVLRLAHPVAALEEQERREHHFLRYLISRGSAQTASIAVFGVECPEAAIARWQRDGLVTVVAETLHATADLVQKIAGSIAAKPEVEAPVIAQKDSAAEIEAPAPFETEAEIEAPVLPNAAAEIPAAKVNAEVVASLLQDAASRERSFPAPSPAVLPQRRFGARDFVLLLLVGFVVVDLWFRFGAPYFLPAQVIQPEPVAAEVPKPATILDLEPVPTLPELSLDAHLSWAIADYEAAFDGLIEWRAQGSGEVRAGEVLGFLVRPQSMAPTGRATLQEQLDGIYREIAVLQTEANESVASDVLQARQARTSAELLESSLIARVALLQESYDRARKLAEDGVLSFREIRPDWDKLQASKEELATVTANFANLQLELEQQLLRQAPNVAEEPIWQVQVASLHTQMEQQAGADLRIPLVAADNGFFVQRVPTDSACSSGEVLGQLRKSGAGHVEAILATSDWDALYLQGVARLRRPQRSSWMPTRILSAESLPTGLTVLRLRLPVGWLDGSSRVSVENSTQLELRLTAPLSPVHEGR